MKKIIKNNYFYLLLLIPIIIFIIHNVWLDNDIWFILNSGKYVINNGIPHFEPFTIHRNLSFVMQQWLSATIFWTVWHYLGKKALYTFIILIGILLTILLYKLFYIVCDKKHLSVIFTVICLYFMNSFITTRPQIFTYCILKLFGN